MLSRALQNFLDGIAFNQQILKVVRCWQDSSVHPAYSVPLRSSVNGFLLDTMREDIAFYTLCDPDLVEVTHAGKNVPFIFRAYKAGENVLTDQPDSVYAEMMDHFEKMNGPTTGYIERTVQQGGDVILYQAIHLPLYCMRNNKYMILHTAQKNILSDLKEAVPNVSYYFPLDGV